MKLVRAEHPINTKQERIHYLDWLRVLVVLGVFYAHTISIFDMLYWHVRSEQPSPGLVGFVDFGSHWGMSLLFLLAGASAWFALRSRTGGQFLAERFKRLAVPFLVGFLLLSPSQAYMEALIRSHYQGAFIQFSLHFFENISVSWNLQWLGTYGYHLWFLAFLFLISALALPLLLYVRREQTSWFICRLVAISARRGGLFVFVLPIALIEVALQVPFPGYQNWADFFAWLMFFLYGYILLSDPRFANAIEKQGTMALLTGVICLLIMIVWMSTGIVNTWATTPAYSVQYLLYQVLYSVTIWSWIVFILYFGMRFLNISNKVIHYGDEAVLPFYILHFPVILITTFYVAQLDIGIASKFLLVSTVSLIVTLTLYECLIRRVNVMRRLFGMKPRTPVVHKDVGMHEYSA